MKLVLIFFFILTHALTLAMSKESKIYIAGHNGLVGSALVELLKLQGYTNLIMARSHELDLRRQEAVEKFFEINKPDYVFLIAAKVGGIKANMTYPADFMYDNLAIELNILHAAHQYKAKKVLFLGSSCIYPRECPQPIKEEYLLTGLLEPTNEYYALAKISGLKLCQAYNKQYSNGTRFIAGMPCNLYGPNDNWDLVNSHVIPALIQKIYKAQQEHASQVTLWGSGNARREFLHVNDIAQACLFLMNNYEGNEIVNIGSGTDLTIKELAYMIKDLVNFEGTIVFDSSFPDGMPQKLLDISRITALGWQPSITLQQGLSEVIQSKYHASSLPFFNT